MICKYHKEECGNSIDDTCDICMEKEIAFLRKAIKEISTYLWHADIKNYDIEKAQQIARKIVG